MKVNDLYKHIEKMLETNPQQNEALFGIIDIKIESDMEKILARIDANSKEIAYIGKEFAVKLDATNKEIASTSKELNAKIDSIKWFIVTPLALFGIIMAMLKLFV